MMDPPVAAQSPIASDAKRGFWRRQFIGFPTHSQIIFDVIFGIAMPVLCFILDPGILTGHSAFPFSKLNLERYSPLIYGLSAVTIPTLGLWLGFGRRVGSRAELMSGVLLAGGICSLAIGVVMLPLSLLALIIGIGALGFTPLLSGFVYARNTVRSFNYSAVTSTKSNSLRTMLLTCALVFGVASFANWEASRVVSRSIEQILSGNEVSIEPAVSRLRHLRWYADLDPIVVSYGNETNPVRKERFQKAYELVTGEDIEERLYILPRVKTPIW